MKHEQIETRSYTPEETLNSLRGAGREAIEVALGVHPFKMASINHLEVGTQSELCGMIIAINAAVLSPEVRAAIATLESALSEHQCHE